MATIDLKKIVRQKASPKVVFAIFTIGTVLLSVGAILFSGISSSYFVFNRRPIIGIILFIIGSLADIMAFVFTYADIRNVQTNIMKQRGEIEEISDLTLSSIPKSRKGRPLDEIVDNLKYDFDSAQSDLCDLSEDVAELTSDQSEIQTDIQDHQKELRVIKRALERNGFGPL